MMLTACGTAGTVATRDAGEVADATLAPDADPPFRDAGRDTNPPLPPGDASLVPQTPECAKRAAFFQGPPFNTDIVLGEPSLPNGTAPPPPREFTGGDQIAQTRAANDAYDVIRGTTSLGDAGVGISWVPPWQQPDLSHRVLRFFTARELLSCNDDYGNREPSAAGMRRVDDSAGNFLFLRALTSLWRSGEVARPALVPYPTGLTVRWEPVVDSCRIGFGAGGPLSDGVVIFGTPSGELRLLSGEQGDLTLDGQAYTVLLGRVRAPPATGNFCGGVNFVLFKKGLFVPPAN
jgi:hypothetical protein